MVAPRHFLQALGIASAGSSFMFQQTAMKAYGQSSMLNALRQVETDRVLVLLQMDGGNDGLNTIVPTTNDIYYRMRPNLSIAKADTMTLTEERGLNMALADLYPFYADGWAAIVEGGWISESESFALPLHRYLDVGYGWRYLCQ